jgi:hypothetical protein
MDLTEKAATMTRERRERLETERWELENSFGFSSFSDGQTRQRIEEITRQLFADPTHGD